MSVEIASWQTRCSECREVYGDTHYSEEEARERDADAGGMCTDCLMAFNRKPVASGDAR